MAKCAKVHNMHYDLSKQQGKFLIFENLHYNKPGSDSETHTHTHPCACARAHTHTHTHTHTQSQAITLRCQNSRNDQVNHPPTSCTMSAKSEPSFIKRFCRRQFIVCVCVCVCVRVLKLHEGKTYSDYGCLSSVSPWPAHGLLHLCNNNK